MFDDFKADEASQSRGDEVVPGLPPGEVPCVMNGATTGAKTGAKTGDEPDETLDVIPTAGAQSGRATEVNATRASAKEGHDSRLKRPLSKRSGGPRSRDGKAVASGNSLKHGAYSTRPVQLDLYHQKLNGVFDELSPSGVIAKTLCGDVAHSLAKLETINTYQRDLIYSAQHDGVSLSELARRLDFPWAQTHLVMLAEPPAQAVLQSQLARSWRTLARPPK